jgi:multidrug efflux pump subunit AcrB
MDEGSVVLDYKSPAGTSLDETTRMLKEVDMILDTTPEVEKYSRRTGTQMGFFITEANDGDYLIQLKKNRDLTTEEVSDEIRKKIESQLPALRVDFGQVIGDMLGDLMASVQPIEIKIFGDDHDKLKEIAKQVTTIIENTNETADVFDGLISAVFLVFTVILFLFRNIRVALAIIFISVLGIAGSVLALLITGTPLNVGSYTGIIMIVGIISENSIFTYLQFREFFRDTKNFEDSIVFSISTRLRPKLMTALGAITALLPLALGIGTGAEMHQPLAIAIIRGLIFALPLLLIVLPTILKILLKESQII